MKDSGRKIYTGIGDKGQTRLLSGDTVEKDDVRVMCYGALDELQSHLGMARAVVCSGRVREILHGVQKDLFVAGAELASTPVTLSRLKKRIDRGERERLERQIDEMTAKYGLPGSFVTPGRSVESAALHVARSVCRRCERLVAGINRETGDYPLLLVYLNRLSDLLFVLAWSLEVRAIIEEVFRDVLNGCPVKGEIS